MICVLTSSVVQENYTVSRAIEPLVAYTHGPINSNLSVVFSRTAATMETADGDACRPRSAGESVATEAETGEHAMYTFVNQHLLSMLGPVIEHVNDLDQEVKAMREESLSKSISMSNTSTMLKQHSEQMLDLKKELAQVSASLVESRKDVGKLKETMQKVSDPTNQAMPRAWHEELSALHRRVQAIDNKDSLEKIAKLISDTQAANLKLAVHDATLHKLQDACNNNQMCANGLSERLEQTKKIAVDTQGDIQRIKTSFGGSLQESKDNFLRATRHSGQTDVKVNRLAEDLKRMADRLSQVETSYSRVEQELSHMEKSLQEEEERHHKEEEHHKASTAAALQRVASQKDVEGKSTFERLSNRMTLMKEELQGLAEKLHEQVSNQVQGISGIVDGNSSSIERHAASLEDLQQKLTSLGGQVTKVQTNLGEQGKLQDLLKEQMDVTDSGIRNLSVSRKAIEAKVGEQETLLRQVDNRVWQTEKDLEGTRSNVESLAVQLGDVDVEMMNMSRRLDVAHGFLQGLGKGIQDTHQQVQGAGGLLQQYKEKRPRNLPGLPASPVPPSRPGTARAQHRADEQRPETPQT
eukprot:TRINITY_DN68472_c0_g1_i1.p1 TRINITY_DN68472_c0_g1~~TRINITY_DN68472_c0_g1_i1.p1  ORF type:complete len:581 (-),score=122.25 TRINITY_DN68472_c0_g1_i1:20-1762(-)